MASGKGTGRIRCGHSEPGKKRTYIFGGDLATLELLELLEPGNGASGVQVPKVP